MVIAKKLEYRKKLGEYLEKYSKFFTISVDNVGSKQIANTRAELRGRGTILMGKNTLIRKCIMLEAERTGKPYERLLEMVEGNIGFVFLENKESIRKIREEIISKKVQAAAKAGSIAPIDVYVQPGSTGMDPSQTSFFQSLNIPTKINRGQIEIVSSVHLIKAGEKVDASAATLLVKLGIRPFYYGIKVKYVHDNGAVYPADVLDIGPSTVINAFNQAVRQVAALCLTINFPTPASVPHSIMDAYKNMLAVGLGCEKYTWENLATVKEILADPTKFAAAAAPAAATGGAPEAAPVEEEPEEEESSAAAPGFGGSSSSDESDESS